MNRRKKKPTLLLNAEQKLATQHIHGPCRIIAGPGSGKTTVIVAKVAHALNQGILPEHILIFTFTKEAALTLKARINDRVGVRANDITIGTYHSICNRILKRYISLLDYNGRYTIYDSADTDMVIKKLCKNTSLKPKYVKNYISKCKRKMQSYEDALRLAKNSEIAYAEIYCSYQKFLKQNNSIDFDDLIFYTVYLLEHFPKIKKQINKEYQYIYADEFHDSAICDLQLVRHLMGENQNLTMVLDNDQSIYGFRGADIDAVFHFTNDISHLQTFLLSQNYRSTQLIVNASRSLIHKNPMTIDKHLFSKEAYGDKILYHTFDSPNKEAFHIVRSIASLHGKFNIPYFEISILFRTFAPTRAIEKALIQYKIPYEIVGHIDILSHKPIKDLLSYLKFANNPYDQEAFKRSILLEKNGVGKSTVVRIIQKSLLDDIDIITAAQTIKLKGKIKEGVNAYIELIVLIRNSFLYMNPEDALNEIINETHFLSAPDIDEETLTARQEYIEILLELSKDYDTVQRMLEELTLSPKASKKEKSTERTDAVKLMSLHGCKGLEFQAVFITNCNEQFIPHAKATLENQVHEERRLFYVGMTRAKQFLFLTRSSVINQFGIMMRCNESRFIKEIEDKYLLKVKG